MRTITAALFVSLFALGGTAFGQNVHSDQDKAQAEQKTMNDKERTEKSGKYNAAANCESKSGHEKEECLEHARSRDADDASASDHDESKEAEEHEEHEERGGNDRR